VAKSLRELDIITGDDRMCHWQFIKAVLEFRYGDLTKEEAIDTMAFYSGLDNFFCEVMLKEMAKESIRTLMISWPGVGKPPPPYHPARLGQTAPGASDES